MSSAHDPEALTAALDRAVVAHFGTRGAADVEAVLVAGCTVVATTIAAVPDPVARGVFLAQAQWTLQRVIAEITRSKAGKRGERRRGPT